MTRLIGELIRPYRWVIAIILAAMLVQTAMSLAGPWPLKIILDNVVVSKHPLPQWMTDLLPVLGGKNKAHIAELAAIFFVIIAIFNAISTYIANYFTESVGQWVAYDLRTRTYHHLQRLSLTYYDSHQVGAIVSTINDDVDTIQDFASDSVTDIIIDVLTIVGILGVMFAIRWDFAVIAVAVTPFLLFFVSRVRNAVKRATHEVRLRQADIVSTVQQGLESVRVVQAFEREDLQEEELSRVGIQTIEAALRARKIKAVLSPVVNIVVAACTGLVLWRGTSLVMSGAMEVGTLTVFLSYLAMFFKPVQDLATMTNTIAQTSVGVERVRAILDADAIIPERPEAIEPQTLRGEIDFEHVSFGYDAAEPVLRDVSFTIRPGQMVGVVGPTGSGKSTVVSLIPRFYDPNAGSIKIDGVDIRDYKLHELRQHIGFVLQDTVLFRGTVRENIAYGHPRATEDEIVQAAKLANAHEFISRMAHGYDSQVGERGLTLSGGQRQRIGIARAIIRDNPILILDEPTAALDTESEQLVVEALERLMKGRTVITIAHRLSTIRDADNIIVLKDGVVAENGTHQQLLALDGVYAGLHRIQYEETSA
jgi:ABC-type multidrug transport system fused ATPase/permease subunit